MPGALALESVYAWTKLITDYANRGQAREALRVYRQMREKGFLPDTYTFVAVLKACGKLADMECGSAIHGHVIESGLQSNVFIASTLLYVYARCGSMVDAFRVFEKMPSRNVVSWNAMINGCANQAPEIALRLYARMQHDRVIPNVRTLVAALKACSGLAAQEQVNQVALENCRSIHAEIVQSGFQSDIYVASTLIDVYGKCGCINDARAVFDLMPSRNLVAWTAMIMGYAQMEEGELALQLYAQAQGEGLRPDPHLYVAALKACGSMAKQEAAKQVDVELMKLGCLEKGKIIHSQVSKSGYEVDIFVQNALVDMYAKCGSMVDAHCVFEIMQHHNVMSWNSMITGYSQMENEEVALQLYAYMQHEGVLPDAHTFVATLTACGSMGYLETGKEIHASVCRMGLEGNSFVITCLVDMYSKCGSMVDAQRLFDACSARDVIRWSALIAGYSDQGDSRCVFGLFEKMQQDGLKPVNITFVSLLNVCSHTGLVEKGKIFFQSIFLNYAIIPDNRHYTCMIDLFGRAGELDGAMAMLKKMPYKPGTMTWMTLLGACQKWNFVEVGQKAFECLVRLDEKHVPAYALMILLYASANMSPVEEVC